MCIDSVSLPRHVLCVPLNASKFQISSCDEGVPRVNVVAFVTHRHTVVFEPASVSFACQPQRTLSLHWSTGAHVTLLNANKFQIYFIVRMWSLCDTQWFLSRCLFACLSQLSTTKNTEFAVTGQLVHITPPGVRAHACAQTRRSNSLRSSVAVAFIIQVIAIHTKRAHPQLLGQRLSGNLANKAPVKTNWLFKISSRKQRKSNQQFSKSHVILPIIHYHCPTNYLL
jgi:hypothetical protein